MSTMEINWERRKRNNFEIIQESIRKYNLQLTTKAIHY